MDTRGIYAKAQMQSPRPLSLKVVAQTTVVIPKPASVVGTWAREAPAIDETDREALQRERSRRNQRKYNGKIKPFSDLARNNDVFDRFKQLWLLTYPQTLEKISEAELDAAVSAFILPLAQRLT